MKKKAKIYAFKEDGKTIYIGKSLNLKNDLSNPSTIKYFYVNDKLKRVANKSIEILEEVEVDNWFDPKLNQIVEKYKAGANLRNAKHFLEGRRGFFNKGEGYWVGKKKDAHTINRMTESKFKEVCQYDLNGNLVHVWNSIISAAKYLGFEINKDKRGVTGSTKLNSILNNKSINSRKYGAFYWIKREDLPYTTIPIRLSIKDIVKKQKIERHKKTIETRRLNGTLKTNNGDKEIVRINSNGSRGKKFSSLIDAGKYYDITPSAISKEIGRAHV